MKKKCVFVGFLSVVVWSITACGAMFSMDSVEASEPQIIVIKDEVVTPLERKPELADVTVEEQYLVLHSEHIEEEIADARVDESDFAADIQGTLVRLDEEINELMNELGEPDSFVETVRNPRIGSDKTYTYDGIIISTNPKNGKDIVSSIQYHGKEKTLSGIGIGSTRADIEAAYGIDYLIDPDYIIYSYGENAKLCFRMKDEECEYIELSWE
ncbi:MAG: hypothetical protein IJO85_00495 [Lachnospiraceae bacterium]|nr:hypothetical protein [Lachnospiraceae bacterium]